MPVGYIITHHGYQIAVIPAQRLGKFVKEGIERWDVAINTRPFTKLQDFIKPFGIVIRSAE